MENLVVPVFDLIRSGQPSQAFNQPGLVKALTDAAEDQAGLWCRWTPAFVALGEGPRAKDVASTHSSFA
jgi:hypothetical protein